MWPPVDNTDDSCTQVSQQYYRIMINYMNYMNEKNSVKMSKSVSGNFLFLHEPTTMRAFPCIAKYNMG